MDIKSILNVLREESKAQSIFSKWVVALSVASYEPILDSWAYKMLRAIIGTELRWEIDYYLYERWHIDVDCREMCEIEYRWATYTFSDDEWFIRYLVDIGCLKEEK